MIPVTRAFSIRQVQITGIALVLVFFIGFVIALLAQRQFEASSTVYVDPDAARVADSTSDPAAQQVLLDSFVAAATSQAAYQQISSSTGAAVGDLQNRLTAEKVGSTNSVELRYQSNDADQARAIVSEAANIAFSEYLRAGLDRVNSTVDVTNQQYQDATNALNQYLRDVGEASPEERYNAVQQRLIDINSGVASGNAQALQDDLNRLQPTVLRFRELLSAQTRLGEIQREAQARALELQSSINTAKSSTSSNPVRVESISRISNAARLGFLTALAVALIVLGVSTVLRYLNSRKELAESSSNSPPSGGSTENSNGSGMIDAPTQKINPRHGKDA